MENKAEEKSAASGKRMSQTASPSGNGASAPVTLETIVGCKWSRDLLNLIRQGITRPGALTRSVAGLTTKVQNDCLRKMTSLNILEKIVYPETPPHVEYRLTDFGSRFVLILDDLAKLRAEAAANKTVSDDDQTGA